MIKEHMQMFCRIRNILYVVDSNFVFFIIFCFSIEPYKCLSNNFVQIKKRETNRSTSKINNIKIEKLCDNWL